MITGALPPRRPCRSRILRFRSNSLDAGGAQGGGRGLWAPARAGRWKDWYMSARYDCTDAAQRAAGISEATSVLRKGELAVMPTDTVYGVAADAFSPEAVIALLAAKGRGRQMPPPVLVGSRRAALALVEDVNASGNDLIDEFWPGGLTMVFRAAKSLVWDLGDTKGTVAVRMPLQPVALDLLRETGPLAVSSANLTGSPAATTAADAETQLGAAVSVYLDDAHGGAKLRFGVGGGRGGG